MRGNKAFDIHENTYRVDADVVACFEHRRYQRRSGGDYYYLSGTELGPDKGGAVINWPNQNYENGVAKNNSTRRRFKSMVRILKRLRNTMEEEGISEARPIPGYLIECLVWNVLNECFGYSTLTEDARSCLVHLFNNTLVAIKDPVDAHQEYAFLDIIAILPSTVEAWEMTLHDLTSWAES